MKTHIDSFLLGAVLIVGIVIAVEVRPKIDQNAQNQARVDRESRDHEHAQFLSQLGVINDFEQQATELMKIDEKADGQKGVQELLVEQTSDIRRLRHALEREIEIEELRHKYHEP